MPRCRHKDAHIVLSLKKKNTHTTGIKTFIKKQFTEEHKTIQCIKYMCVLKKNLIVAN